MPPELLYETVCPACNKPFDVDADAEAGNCPHCNAYLRFETEEEAPAPEPQPEPPARPKRIRREPEPEPEAPEEPKEAPPPRVGEFRVTCPACSRGFNIAVEANRAECPYCESSLVFEDEYAERGVEYPVQCPVCESTLEVRLDQTRGTCPHCKTALVYDEVGFRAFELPPREPEPEPVPEAPPKKVMAPIEPEPPAAAPEPEAAEPALPLAKAPPEGVPLAVDCPSCKKSFGIPSGTKQGNCPHCNAPLAFVSDKEFLAFQEAEDRKKQFQQKLAERRLKQKEKELARQRKEEEKRPTKAEEERAVAPTPVEEKPPEPKGLPLLRRLAIFRLRRKSEPAPTAALAQVSTEIAPITPQKPRRSGAPARPAEAVIEFEEVAVPPARPPKAGKGKAPPAPAPEIAAPPPTAPIEVEIEAASEPEPSPAKMGKKAKTAPVVEVPVEVIAEAFSATPSEAATPKKGLFGWLRRGTPKPSAPESAPAAIEVEQIEVASAAPTRGRSAAHDGTKRLKEGVSTVEVGEIELVPMPSVPAAKKGGKAKPSPAEAVVETEEIVVAAAPPSPPADVEISIDLGSPKASKKPRRR